jgi:hypothetical protein
MEFVMFNLEHFRYGIRIEEGIQQQLENRMLDGLETGCGLNGIARKRD